VPCKEERAKERKHKVREEMGLFDKIYTTGNWYEPKKKQEWSGLLKYVK